MFKCALAGGGDGASLIVTCTQLLAGSTITLTNGVKTYTQVCPLSRPYKVTFENVATGVWTVRGIAQGQTISISVTITDFEALLADLPEGSTATPTDDIQIWLHCADIWDKNYTSISEIFSDASTLQTLIASNNAADYMARSTNWASSVCANSNAMTYIGVNDYCANKLLANSTWCTAICNSIYFESVLNAKVPTMTSNTAPSGTANSSSNNSNSAAYYAFDGASTVWFPAVDATNNWVSYQFTKQIRLAKVVATLGSWKGPTLTFKIQAYNGSKWVDLGTMTNESTPSTKTVIINNNTKYQAFRLFTASVMLPQSGYSINVNELQFYGRT
jgi:hypothetical protein